MTGNVAPAPRAYNIRCEDRVCRELAAASPGSTRIVLIPSHIKFAASCVRLWSLLTDVAAGGFERFSTLMAVIRLGLNTREGGARLLRTGRI